MTQQINLIKYKVWVIKFNQEEILTNEDDVVTEIEKLLLKRNKIRKKVYQFMKTKKTIFDTLHKKTSLLERVYSITPRDTRGKRTCSVVDPTIPVILPLVDFVGVGQNR